MILMVTVFLLFNYIPLGDTVAADIRDGDIAGVSTNPVLTPLDDFSVCPASALHP